MRKRYSITINSDQACRLTAAMGEAIGSNVRLLSKEGKAMVFATATQIMQEHGVEPPRALHEVGIDWKHLPDGGFAERTGEWVEGRGTDEYTMSWSEE